MKIHVKILGHLTLNIFLLLVTHVFDFLGHFGCIKLDGSVFFSFRNLFFPKKCRKNLQNYGNQVNS